MTQSTIISGEDEFLYQQVAERIESLIYGHVLKAGDKLISVRALSREQGISMSTAYKAYSELEMRGLIEARPKSGYYVKYIPSQLPRIEEVKEQGLTLKKMDVQEMITLVFKNLSQSGVIRLSLAAPDVSLLPLAKLNKSLIEVVRQSPTGCVHYENIQGNVLLRQQIARLAFNWDGNISGEDVVTTQGCMESLVFCLKAVTEPGDTVAIESPTYFGIFNVIQSLGLKVIEIPTHPEHGISLEQLEKAIKRIKIKACLFATNFSNPTGYLMPDKNKKKLVELLADKNIPLIEDDIYGELYFGKQRPRNCKSYDKKGLVLLCSSISKSLAPGYRVGWCIPGKFTQKVINIKLMHTVSTATPTQAAIGHFFEIGRFDLHMRHLRKALHTQCLLYSQAISEYFPANTKITRPKGGYVLWVQLHKRVNAFQLFQQAIEQNISIAPGQLFSSDARFTNYIRISFGMPYSEEIDRSLKTVGRLAKKLSEKK